MSKRLTFDGERFDEAGTALTWARAGDPARSTVVFVPGAGHLARIAYGTGEVGEDDFLAHWVLACGNSFVGVSYALGHPLFPAADPDLSVAVWAEQVAAATAEAIAREGMSSDVVVAAWSMAGRLVYRLRRALEARGLRLRLFVSLEGASGTPNPGDAFEPLLLPDAQGLARVDVLLDFFLAAIADQRRRADSAIVDDASFARDYVGAFPVNLAGTVQRRVGEAFVVDIVADLDDTGACDLTSLPPVAFLTGADGAGPDHALLEATVWGHLATRAMAQRAAERAASRAPAALRWDAISARLHTVPALLSGDVDGGHFFFVGQPGARRTAELLDELAEAAERFARELDELVDHS
jgi:hypothetical protein